MTVLRAEVTRRRFGVQLNLTYTDSAVGADTQGVCNLVRALGIDLIRTGLFIENKGDNNAWWIFDTARKNGLRMHVGVSMKDGAGNLITIAEHIAALRKLVDAGCQIVSISGPNEVNNKDWAAPYKQFGIETDADRIAAAQHFTLDLMRAIKADPALAAIEVTGWTGYDAPMLPPGSTEKIAAEVHSYPKDQKTLMDILPHDCEGVRKANPGCAWDLTETGYSTSVNDGWTKSVSEELQGTLLMQCYLDALALGARRVFMYQLSNNYGDDENGALNFENGWGLAKRWRNTPKPSFAVMQRFFRLWRDDGHDALRFALPAWRYGLTAAGGFKGSGLGVAFSDGSRGIWVWDHNPPSAKVTTKVGVDLGGTFARVDAFRPSDGDAAFVQWTGASKVTLALDAKPVFLRLR